MHQKSDGMNYAPKGQTRAVCGPGEFRIGDRVLIKRAGEVIPYVIGPVVDVEFEGGHLPAIYSALRILGEIDGQITDRLRNCPLE